MASPDNFYSKFVTWMKIILPVAALGLLSTLFLISQRIDPTEPVSVVQIDLEKRAQELGATSPSFAGVTSGGDQVMIQAERARPDLNDREHLIATTVTAQIRLLSGAVIDIESNNAELHQGRLTAMLDGNVHVTTTTGYIIDTEELHTRIDELYAETPGPVSGSGPPGDLNAGKMLLLTDETTGDTHLLFTQGVKLIYHPGKNKE